MSCSGGDLAMLWPAHQTVVHECVVDRVTRDTVLLRMSPTAKEAWYVCMQCVHAHAHTLSQSLSLSLVQLLTKPIKPQHLFHTFCTKSCSHAVHAPGCGRCSIGHFISISHFPCCKGDHTSLHQPLFSGTKPHRAQYLTEECCPQHA